MRTYKSEAVFSRHLVDTLKLYGYVPTRIETKTQVGVPDIYYSSKKGCGWIETKLVKQEIVTGVSGKILTKPKVPFRPGQQEWALSHYFSSKKPVLCAIAFINVVCVYPMTRLFEDGVVPGDSLILTPHLLEEEQQVEQMLRLQW